MSSIVMTIISTNGFVSKKRNYFERLTLLIWFIQLVISYVVALS